MKLPNDLRVLLSLALIASVLFASFLFVVFALAGAFDRHGATASGGDSLERGCGMIFLSTYDKASGDLSRRERDETAVCTATGNYHAPVGPVVFSREETERNRRDVQELNREIHHWPVAALKTKGEVKKKGGEAAKRRQ